MITEIFADVARIVLQKDHDYNHAFDRACDMMGNMYAAGKVYEKTMRIITLTHKQALVSNEGLEDALKDCIGYCALYLNRLQNQKAQEEQP